MQEHLPRPREEVSQEDWEKTPESVKRLVKSLVARVEQLEQQYEELKTEHQLLQEQVKQNSQNSSKPPLQDVSKGFKPKERHKSGKQRGAQPRHEGHERHFYSLEQCQRVENHRPDVCGYCGRRLHGEDQQPYRVQIVEIP